MYMVDKRTQHVGQHSANMLHMLANMLRWFKPALSFLFSFLFVIFSSFLHFFLINEAQIGSRLPAYKTVNNNYCKFK